MREAEEALWADHDPIRALELLTAPGLADHPFGRRLLLEAAQASGDPRRMVAALGEPRIVEELVALFDAHIALGGEGDPDGLLVRHASHLGLPEAVRRDMESKMNLSKWGRP